MNEQYAINTRPLTSKSTAMISVISWAYGVNFHIITTNKCMHAADESCALQ
jgi:hypothetical protein